MRRRLAPITRLAETKNVTVIALAHLNEKAEIMSALHRIGGSVAMHAGPRVVLLVVPDPEGAPTDRLLAVIKNNVGPLAPTLKFQVDGATVTKKDGGEIKTMKIVWGQTSMLSGNEALAMTSSKSGRDGAERVREAQAFLQAYLVDGEKPVKEVHDAAQAYGIAVKTLQRAKQMVGVQARRESKDGTGKGQWVWVLPSEKKKYVIPEEFRAKRAERERRKKAGDGSTAPA